MVEVWALKVCELQVGALVPYRNDGIGFWFYLNPLSFRGCDLVAKL